MAASRQRSATWIPGVLLELLVVVLVLAWVDPRQAPKLAIPSSADDTTTRNTSQQKEVARREFTEATLTRYADAILAAIKGKSD